MTKQMKTYYLKSTFLPLYDKIEMYSKKMFLIIIILDHDGNSLSGAAKLQW